VGSASAASTTNAGNYQLTVGAAIFTNNANASCTITTTDVEAPVSSRILLGPPAPNPTQGSLAFTVNLPRTARVRLGIYDVRGRLVRVVADQTLGAGLHHLRWSGRLPSDQYLLRLESEGAGRTRKFTVIH
jgi:flagellar hook assembly protein FlgD